MPYSTKINHSFLGKFFIYSFTWTDFNDSLQITEKGITHYVYIDNEADDLSDNVINDLSDVNAVPSTAGEVLEWNGTQFNSRI